MAGLRRSHLQYGSVPNNRLQPTPYSLRSAPAIRRGCAYGARPGRRPPHAVDAVPRGMAQRHSTWVLDAAMRGVYAALAHAWRVQVVAPRLGDQRVGRHRRPGLTAGVLEDGQWRPQAAGTPPGGSARPILAHRSLHEVCARWAAPWRRRDARGDLSIVRYGDEVSGGVQSTDAAAQWLRARRDRFPRCHLARHPDKTRLMAGGR